MMYYEVNIGDNAYKLRLNTRGCVEVEKRLGKNPLSIFANVNEGNLPAISDLAVIFQAALKPYHREINEEKAFDLIDTYVEEKGFVEFLNMIIEVLKASGLISIDGEKDNSKN